MIIDVRSVHCYSSVSRPHVFFADICRIIGNCWNDLPEEEKQIWRDMADAEKADHARRHPGYRFSPVYRLEKPAKRRVQRNGAKEIDRCRIVADLLLAGKEGQDLESAINNTPSAAAFQDHYRSPVSPSPIRDWEPTSRHPEEANLPPFTSPILPPPKSWDASPKYMPTPSIPPVESRNNPLVSLFLHPQSTLFDAL